MERLKLKAARVQTNLTQEQAAKMIGVSKTTLSNYERGWTSPNAKTLKKICEVYKIEMSEVDC